MLAGGLSCFHGDAPDCLRDSSRHGILHIFHSNQCQCGKRRGLLYPIAKSQCLNGLLDHVRAYVYMCTRVYLCTYVCAVHLCTV